MMRLLFWAAVALAGMASPAFAHAFLQRAEPAVGSEVHAAPPAVIITFTEGVEPSFSTIEVDGPGGKIEIGTPERAGDVRRLKVTLPKLAPGTYTVIWHATSVDTHKTEGTFKFSVVQ